MDDLNRELMVEFGEFARSKGEETFNYLDNGNCAVAQFFKSKGHTRASVNFSSIVLDGVYRDELDSRIFDEVARFVGLNVSARAHPWSRVADNIEDVLTDKPMRWSESYD
jgi:hypothetical protein